MTECREKWSSKLVFTYQKPSPLPQEEDGGCLGERPPPGPGELPVLGGTSGSPPPSGHGGQGSTTAKSRNILLPVQTWALDSLLRRSHSVQGYFFSLNFNIQKEEQQWPLREAKAALGGLRPGGLNNTKLLRPE